jgi:hypothetical protein
MKTAISGLVAFCVATVAAALAGTLAGGLTPLLAWTSLAWGATAGSLAWGSMHKPFPGTPVRGWVAWSLIAVFTLFALRAFCWLVFIKDGEIAFLSPNNLGDLSLHLTFIRNFANGAPLWPENPIFSAAPLHYPFGVDLFNSLLTLAGLDELRGLVWVGLLGAFATGVMLWRWGGAFAMAGFLFNGGVAGFALFFTGKLADYQAELDWKSIPLALFVTQRGLLYALPAGLALLWSWRERLLAGRRGLPVWIEWLLYATLPLFHLHTFIFLSLMLGMWMLWPGANLREIVRLGLASLIPATVLIWQLTGGFHSGTAMHLTPGWMSEIEAPLYFWLNNFGLFPVVAAVTLGWLWYRRQCREAALELAIVLPALLIFRMACFVMFAVWAWDNTKILIWGYLCVLPATGAVLMKAPPLIRTAICLLLFGSGAISLVGGLDASHTGFTLARCEELDSLERPLKKIPVSATFAAMPTYNHPLLLLGRKVVAGYEGHLFSHGIDYKPRFDALETLLRGKPGWQLRARQLGVDYLYWGPREREKYGGATPWKTVAPVVAEGTWGTIYDLRKLAIPQNDAATDSGNRPSVQ